MRSIKLPGQHASVLCEQCQRRTEGVFEYGPLEFDGQTVEDVLRLVCRSCGEVAAIAGQSTHRLRSTRQDRSGKRTSLRLPMELADFVGLKLSLAGADSTHTELFFRALLLAANQHHEELAQALPQVRDPVLEQPLRVGVNLSLSGPLRGVLEALQEASGLDNASEVLRRLVVLADQKPFGPAVHQAVVDLAMAYA